MAQQASPRSLVLGIHRSCRFSNDSGATSTTHHLDERLLYQSGAECRLSRSRLFTDRHTFFRGRAAGIGDYLCLGRAFQDGGGPPGAVTIHAAYKDLASQHVRIEHFVSDDQIQLQVDTAVKFLQAAGKLVNQVRRRPNEFGSNPALNEFERLVQESLFPQLAGNKKLQIVHHMCLMMDVLQGRL